MRVSYHKGRRGNAHHNARTSEKALEHVDYSKTPNDLLICKVGTEFKTLLPGENHLFPQYEFKAYENIYTDGLNARNERYKKNRHEEKTKTMKQLYENPKTRPMEIILQIGKENEFDKEDVKNRKDFLKIVLDHVAWLEKTFKNVEVLSIAFHEDECSQHVHINYTVKAQDKDGYSVPNQDKGFEEMGIERPNPTKARSRFNNRLQTFTKQEREHYIRTVQQIRPDLNLDLEPLPKAKQKHLEKYDYQIKTKQEKLEELNNNIEKKANYLEKLLVNIGIAERLQNQQDEIERGRAKTRPRTYQKGR